MKGISLMIIICVLSPPVFGIIAIWAKLVIAMTIGSGLIGIPAITPRVSGSDRSLTQRNDWPRISTAWRSIE